MIRKTLLIAGLALAATFCKASQYKIEHNQAGVAIINAQGQVVATVTFPTYGQGPSSAVVNDPGNIVHVTWGFDTNGAMKPLSIEVKCLSSNLSRC